MNAPRTKKVFISYAHADNVRKEGRKLGWVSSFVRDVKSEVARRAGGAEVEVWFDFQLETNRNLDDALREEIRSSQVILALVSPRYLESDWCTKEMSTFIGEVGGGKAHDRVFIVELLPTRRDQWHAGARGLVAMEFWQRDEENPEAETLGWPVPDPAGDRPYWSKVNALASRIARQLEEGQKAAPRAESPAAGAQAPADVPDGKSVAPRPAQAEPNMPLSILVSTDGADETLALDAQAMLESMSVHPSIDFPPTPKDPPALYRKNFEDQLRDSRGVIVVYGEAPRSWVQQKLRDVRKVLALERKGTWAGVIDGPPVPKAPHGVSACEAVILDCRQGLDPSELRRFVDMLRDD